MLVSSSGSPSRPRARRAAVAAAGGLGLVLALAGVSQTETVAAFADSVWAGGTFNVAEVVDLESSPELNGTFADHDSENALELFSTPLSLVPGQTKYAHFYIRTSGLSTAATVSMSSATNAPAASAPEIALWATYIKYGALAVDANADPDCGTAFSANPQGTVLVQSGSGLGSAPSATFDLLATGENTIRVCFEFSLLGSAVTASPSVNGASIEPTWTFTGEALTP